MMTAQRGGEDLDLFRLVIGRATGHSRARLRAMRAVGGAVIAGQPVIKPVSVSHGNYRPRTLNPAADYCNSHWGEASIHLAEPARLAIIRYPVKLDLRTFLDFQLNTLRGLARRA